MLSLVADARLAQEARRSYNAKMSTAPDPVFARAASGSKADASAVTDAHARKPHYEDEHNSAHHHGRSHGHHLKSGTAPTAIHAPAHDHAEHGHPFHAHPQSAPGVSLLRLSAQSRMFGALVLIACIWAGVFWAIA